TDPTAGAGLAADTLTLASLGCHPAPVVTAVTAQDTRGIKQFLAMPTELVIAQARAVLEDMPVADVKPRRPCTSAVPSPVARRVAPQADSLDACAQELLSLGCEYVLITGTHEPGARVRHRLYGNKRLLDTFDYERLPHGYHGSGCTLAAACAAALAHGLEPAN